MPPKNCLSKIDLTHPRYLQTLVENRRIFNISEVSCRCGFNDVNYFVRIFRKLESITPGAYKGCVW